MAVTYAWRLDANKYAYLIDPTKDKLEYGYVDEAPLNGAQLASVAQTCNKLFREGGTLGFTGYTEAYNAMINKIKNEWGNAQFYDLLSADVYYNVDASQCVDLKGVGIRGIRYLGASTAYDPENPSWDPSIKQTNTTELAGKFSIYGIYMDDQDYEGDDGSTLTPERIFAVYNGKNGMDLNGNLGTAELEIMIREEKQRSEAEDLEHSNNIAILISDVDKLKQLDTGGLLVIDERVRNLERENTILSATIKDLNEKVTKLAADLESVKNSSNSENNNDPSSDSEVKLSDYEGGIVYLVGTDQETKTLYKLPAATYNAGDISSEAFYQKKIM
jgi:ABC-type transporter Mla MlaB component